ncbi:MAG: hypothetical protein L6R42_004123 [Xanthoria sp. 1 TBL-2021]|nr:MAG: hypothetical protein L6R42_004123 [Xanthoria sp. 1 TBL-2021]
MPGEKWDTTARFPFHMTASSSIGLVFTNYDHWDLIDNPFVNQILTIAIRAVGADLTRDPSLANRPVRDKELNWPLEDEEIALYMQPEIPSLTYGNIFVIYSRPGTPQQKELGLGHFLPYF